MLICLVQGLLAGPAVAAECWTGWGYLVEPGSHRYKSGRLLVASDGPVTWAPGAAVVLHVLDGEKGGRRSDVAPLTVYPANPRFSRRQGLDHVSGVASVVGSPDFLAFGLSHVAPSVTGIERLDGFYRWACGLEASRR